MKKSLLSLILLCCIFFSCGKGKDHPKAETGKWKLERITDLLGKEYSEDKFKAGDVFMLDASGSLKYKTQDGDWEGTEWYVKNRKNDGRKELIMKFYDSKHNLNAEEFYPIYEETDSKLIAQTEKTKLRYEFVRVQ